MRLTYQKKGNLTHTLIGSPTVTGGSISGFSSSNYVKLPVDLNQATFEIVTQVTPSLATNSGVIVGDNVVPGLLLRFDGNKLVLFLSSDGTSSDIANGVTTSATFAAGTPVWVKLSYDGAAYRLATSSDGQDYTTQLEIASTTYLQRANGYLTLGYSAWINGYLLGSLALDKTYVTLNGRRVFFKRAVAAVTCNATTVWEDN